MVLTVIFYIGMQITVVRTVHTVLSGPLPTIVIELPIHSPLDTIMYRALVWQEVLIEKVLSDYKFDTNAIAKSKRDSDHTVSHIQTNYRWIGKNRTRNQGEGIGFLYNKNTVSINDANFSQF